MTAEKKLMASTATRIESDSFGEIAVLHGVPRRATVRAETAVTTSRIHRSDVLAARAAMSARPAAP